MCAISLGDRSRSVLPLQSPRLLRLEGGLALLNFFRISVCVKNALRFPLAIGKVKPFKVSRRTTQQPQRAGCATVA